MAKKVATNMPSQNFKRLIFSFILSIFPNFYYYTKILYKQKKPPFSKKDKILLKGG
ncbi:hypothetical protein HPMG_00072 [Helicobacter pullorum MIT 98-5489]|uniref:Uncharacterized protein n=1 Tax=Helicobacter pullorum MIT 98-5489 TaxID=537972 RepID=C5EX71_9HELI|nr:hypothetical protein HPMG_00072 [Helicobacter pullorum MIT 98-5489]